MLTWCRSKMQHKNNTLLGQTGASCCNAGLPETTRGRPSDLDTAPRRGCVDGAGGGTRNPIQATRQQSHRGNSRPGVSKATCEVPRKSTDRLQQLLRRSATLPLQLPATATGVEVKRIFRMKELCQTYGLSRSTIYRLIDAGRFPKPIKISAKAVGWISTDLDEWLANRGAC